MDGWMQKNSKGKKLKIFLKPSNNIFMFSNSLEHVFCMYTITTGVSMETTSKVL